MDRDPSYQALMGNPFFAPSQAVQSTLTGDASPAESSPPNYVASVALGVAAIAVLMIK